MSPANNPELGGLERELAAFRDDLKVLLTVAGVRREDITDLGEFAYKLARGDGIGDSGLVSLRDFVNKSTDYHTLKSGQTPTGNQFEVFYKNLQNQLSAALGTNPYCEKALNAIDLKRLENLKGILIKGYSLRDVMSGVNQPSSERARLERNSKDARTAVNDLKVTDLPEIVRYIDGTKIVYTRESEEFLGPRIQALENRRKWVSGLGLSATVIAIEYGKEIVETVKPLFDYSLKLF